MMKKIAIIGAGINGLVLAISLRKLGFTAEQIAIYEKSETPRAEGTGIIFWAEAIDILKALDIDLTTIGVCLPKVKSIFLQPDQEPVELDVEKPPQKHPYGLLREKVYTQLQRHLEALGVEIQCGYQCETLSNVDERYQIKFKGNDELVQADIVIGCDGINSVVRQSIAPDNQPIPMNIRAFRGTYAADADTIAELGLPTDTCHIYCGNNSRVILYQNHYDESSQLTSYYWFAAHRVAPEEVAQDISKVSSENIEDLITHLPLSTELLQRIFSTTPLEKIITTSTLKQMQAGEFVNDKIALVGDAVHAMAPTAGLGFFLGVNNVLHLACNLAKYQDNPKKALSNYRDAVTEHSAQCLDYTSRLTNVFYTEHPLAALQAAGKIYQELFEITNDMGKRSLFVYKSTQQQLAGRRVSPQSVATTTYDQEESILENRFEVSLTQ